MRRSLTGGLLLAAVLGLLLPSPVRSQAVLTPETARADYERLKEWRFSKRPAPLPAAGVTWTRDAAEWRLESGRFWLQEPLSDGTVTGLVFEGRGRFRMTVPDPVELAQLRRFVRDEELEVLDEEFTQLVLRTSDPTLLADLAAPAGGYGPHRPARERHEHWLRVRRHDADSRVVSAYLNSGWDYLRVEVKTRRRGWLTWDYDSRRHEEIRLEKYLPSHSFLEHWLSLDRAADRRDDGRPGRYGGADGDLEHLEIEAELLRLGKDPGLSETARHQLAADLRNEVSFRVQRPGLRALQLYLHPWAELESVRDEEGRELPFLRDHIGGRRANLDKRIYDLSLVVVLPEAPEPGTRRTLTFDYELETTNYMPGRAWYPTFQDFTVAPTDLHTARLRLVTRDEHETRAMGELIEEREANGLRTAVWRVSEPVKMVTFSLTRRVRELRFAGAAPPEVVVFSPPLGHDTDRRLEEIGAEVRGSIDFFQRLFDLPLAGERLYATLIQALHGQAFEGFLHLGEFSAYRARTGPMELFVAHEVAHQWWGHLVGWSSYRDQWLSEGLAQYSAMLYLEATHYHGDRLFREAVQAFRDEVVGSIKSSLSPFSRGMALDNKAASDRVGPIGHGYRAAVRESPDAYVSQSYLKGALVLHMLRQQMRFVPGGEETFYAILRDFARLHLGGTPATDDLAAVVSRHAPGDWDWFFEQWVEQAAVPAYDWKTRSAAADGGWRIEIEVEQRGVPDGFRMPVPVRIEYEGGGEEDLLVLVDRPRGTYTLSVDRSPRRIVFNPDHAVLAR